MRGAHSKKDCVFLMMLSSKQEVFCWLIGVVAAIELFVHSHTFNVTAATYYYGFVLLCVVVFLFWLRFRRRTLPEPRWLRSLANCVLVIVIATFLLYAAGVATWYE
jgi:drug/metabolite transporter (DMT)-like permease